MLKTDLPTKAKTKTKTILKKIMHVFDIKANDREPRMFDNVSGILFWDNINNDKYNEIHDEMMSKFWIPKEVSMAGDGVHWNGKMSDEEKEMYKTGIGVLATLDSVSTYFDKIASDYIQDSAIKACMSFVAAMETIHNKSYTYTMSSLVSKEESIEAFERPKKLRSVAKRNDLIMNVFDTFIAEPTVENFAKSLVAMSGLEGVAFVNGFTPFYYLNDNGKMIGTGSIIQFIQRDETLHTDLQTTIVNDICEQYPEDIDRSEFEKWCHEFFTKLVELEREFCKELYTDIYDIDVDEVCEFIGYRANVVLDNLRMKKIFAAKRNPMAWIEAFNPDNLNNVKTDFFEDKERNYQKTTSNGWEFL